MFKKILLLGLIVAVIGGIFAYRIWNKPHEDIRKQRPATTMTATQLLSAFEADAEAKDADLTEVVLILEGEPSNSSFSDEFQMITFDEGGDFVIQAYLPKAENESFTWKDGQSVRMLCKYSGYIINDESFLIPADIKLEPCYIQD